MGSGIRVQRVRKVFGQVMAVREVSFEAAPGEFVVLLGPSGCGKTTTLRIIAGLTRPSSGRVFIGSIDITDRAAYERDIGMVFQNYALFPHMTVGGNIAFGLQMRRWNRDRVRKRVREMLELVRLPGLEDRMPHELSGGQQQRVALARALAPNPQVLLLDEPLSNLDLKLRQELRRELKRIQREVGVTTVFVTHDQGEALSMADKILVMRDGLVEQAGSPEELYRRPATRFVATFLGEANLLPGVVKKSGKDGLVRTDQGVLVAVSDLAYAEGSRVEVVVRPEDMRVFDNGPGDKGLNAVEAEVDELIYVGTAFRLHVKWGDRSLLADVPQRVGARLASGMPVTLAWSPDCCTAILEREAVCGAPP